MVSAATELGLPIIIPMRAVDKRKSSWLVDVPDVAVGDVVALVRRHHEARFILLNGVGLAGSPLVTAREELPGNYWLGISRMPLFISCEIPQLLESLGPERLLFATGMPFKYVDPVLLKMEKLEATQEAKNAILGGNLAELIGG